MAVTEISVSRTQREGYLFKWTTQSKGFAYARDAEAGSGHSTNKDMGVGTFWKTTTSPPRVYVYRTFIQFSVPSGLSTSGKSAVLKLYGRTSTYADTAPNGFAAGFITEPVTVPDIQVFACDSIPNMVAGKRYIYSSFTSTAYSPQITGISADGGWVEITLNSAALAAIDTAAGGDFDLCIREYAHDVGNSDPGASSGVTYFWQFASMKATGLAPRIIVADAGFNHNLLGITKSSISKVNSVSMASPQEIERINDIQ
jgi:hypothetical protein